MPHRHAVVLGVLSACAVDPCLAPPPFAVDRALSTEEVEALADRWEVQASELSCDQICIANLTSEDAVVADFIEICDYSAPSEETAGRITCSGTAYPSTCLEY